jgi:hypothetical protein
MQNMRRLSHLFSAHRLALLFLALFRNACNQSTNRRAIRAAAISIDRPAYAA